MKLGILILTMTFLSVFVCAVAGEDYVCDNNGNKRIVSIIYQNEEAPVPCEVRYDKGEGVQTLWTAQSESGFCEARVNEFIEKQESWGFTCSKFVAPEVSETEPVKEMMDSDSEEVVVDALQEDLHTSIY